MIQGIEKAGTLQMEWEDNTLEKSAAWVSPMSGEPGRGDSAKQITD